MNSLAFRAADYVSSAPRRLKNRFLNMFAPPVVVLLYHRINSLKHDPYSLAVTQDNFRDHLRLLKQNFDIVGFGEDWAHLKRPTIAITFDDGYADNFRNALPVLEEMKIPAAFFISTGIIGTDREFWWDELERIVLGDRPVPGQFELQDSRFGGIWPAGSVADRRVLSGKLHMLMFRIDEADRERWLGQLRQWAVVGEEGREVNRAMSLEELRRLDRSGMVTVGAHTVNHTPLSTLPAADQMREIKGSKDQLEKWLGHDIVVFSYPFGRRIDYTHETVDLCRKAGFIRAAANFPGQVRKGTDPYQIPRQTVLNWSVELFSRELKRFLTV